MLIRKVIALLFISSISTLAYSQRYISFRDEREEIQRTEKYKFGPFWISPSIGIRDFGRDGNVYYEREDEGPVSDYTFALVAATRVSWLLRRSIIFSLRENPEYVYYFEEKKERGWNNLFSPEVRVLILNRFAFKAGYLKSKTRYRATAEFNSRVNVYREGYNGSVFFETPRGNAFGFSGSNYEIKYGDTPEFPISRLLNRKEKEVNLEFYYRVFPESYFFIRGGYREYNFMDPGYRWRDSYSYQAYSGIQFPILGRIRGALSLGYKKFLPRHTGKQEFSGLVGDTNLSLRVSRFGFRFGFIRDSYFSYYLDSLYFIENRLGGGASFYLTRFLRLDYDFSYGEGNYPEETSIVTPEGGVRLIKRSDINRIHSAGLVVRITRSTGIGIAMNYWERESNAYLEDRQRLFWGAFLTYEF